MANAKLCARALGLDTSVRFRAARISELKSFEEESTNAFHVAAHDTGALAPHVVIALHGCDIASDEAIAFAVRSKSHTLLVAPCCQAELAAKWAASDRLLEEDGGLPESHPFALIYSTPNLRREVAAHITDALRVSLLKAAGYGVHCREFVSSEHTPKNRMLLARRMRPNDASKNREASLAEYDALREATGGYPIILEDMLLRQGLLPGYFANDWD